MNACTERGVVPPTRCHDRAAPCSAATTSSRRFHMARTTQIGLQLLAFAPALLLLGGCTINEASNSGDGGTGGSAGSGGSTGTGGSTETGGSGETGGGGT